MRWSDLNDVKGYDKLPKERNQLDDFEGECSKIEDPRSITAQRLDERRPTWVPLTSPQSKLMLQIIVTAKSLPQD